QEQIVTLEAELDRGPGTHGWDDQRWTLARVTTLIKELFRIDYTPRGVSYLLHRIGWSPQVPVHRAVERDEEQIATWVKETWPPPRQAPGVQTTFRAHSPKYQRRRRATTPNLHASWRPPDTGDYICRSW
ncbi:winged helix-turn-helix domain-containing protein, partial [Nonomuraea sp. M3C6]